MQPTLVALDISHKPTIDTLCAKLSAPLSEYNFANLFLFQHVHQYSVLDLESPHPAIVGIRYDQTTHYMPLYIPDNWHDCIEKARNIGVESIFPIPETWAEEAIKQGFPIKYFEDDSDYIFNTEDIREYHGRHYDGQRNAVRHCSSNHTIEAILLQASTKLLAQQVLEQWAHQHGSEEQHQETLACQRAITDYDLLGLTGWIYIVDKVAGALIIGCPQNHETFCIHFAKHLPIKGLGAYAFQHFARSLPPFTLLNWEQDLGDPFLRQFKTSYRPKTKAKKGVLKLIQPQR